MSRPSSFTVCNCKIGLLLKLITNLRHTHPADPMYGNYVPSVVSYRLVDPDV
jgi:hypothetical protein